MELEQTSGEWTPLGDHIESLGLNHFVKTGKQVTAFFFFTVAANTDTNPIFITGLPATTGVVSGSVVLKPQTACAITTPIIGGIYCNPPDPNKIYFTGLAGLGSVLRWQDFSGAELQGMVTYFEY